ncbi:hypothetical protein ACMAZF_04595 [Psychrobium sp. nBUS_13]|uniref:hypothetical protein n=1 Tax=Psychrobium sp. nBUS_13 TaxID=3395319 RepID=UPI003EBC8324
MQSIIVFSLFFLPCVSVADDSLIFFWSPPAKGEQNVMVQPISSEANKVDLVFNMISQQGDDAVFSYTLQNSEKTNYINLQFTMRDSAQGPSLELLLKTKGFRQLFKPKVGSRSVRVSIEGLLNNELNIRLWGDNYEEFAHIELPFTIGRSHFIHRSGELNMSLFLVR